MLTSQKPQESAIISMDMADKSIDELLSREWLLTNGRGGFASSTIVGCNTRRYHSLLTGSLNPPVNRDAAVKQYEILKTLDANLANQFAGFFK